MNMTMDLSVNIGGQTTQSQITKTGDAAVIADISVVHSSTDLEADVIFKIADLSAGGLVLINTAAVILTVKTNSSGSPDDTFTVPASGFVDVQSLAADIASLFITNPSGSVDAVLKLRGVRDVTP